MYNVNKPITVRSARALRNPSGYGVRNGSTMPLSIHRYRSPLAIFLTGVEMTGLRSVRPFATFGCVFFTKKQLNRFFT